MLNKDLVYEGYLLTGKGYKYKYVTVDQRPCKKLTRVKILYEDDISWYVKSLIKKDSQGNGIHYSVKKHWYRLLPVRDPIPDWSSQKGMEFESQDLIHILELTEKSIRTPVDRTGILLRSANWLKVRAMLYYLLRLTEAEGNTIYYEYEKKRLEERKP